MGAGKSKNQKLEEGVVFRNNPANRHWDSLTEDELGPIEDKIKSDLSGFSSGEIYNVGAIALRVLNEGDDDEVSALFGVPLSLRGDVEEFSAKDINLLPIGDKAELLYALKTAAKLNSSINRLMKDQPVHTLGVYNKGNGPVSTANAFFSWRLRHLSLNSATLSNSDRSGVGYTVSSLFKEGHSKVTVAHEFGHSLENMILRSPSPTGRYLKFVESVQHSSAITNYGNMDRREAFAEAFTAYTLGVKSTKVGSHYYSEFKSFMQDSGLSDLFGSV